MEPLVFPLQTSAGGPLMRAGPRFRNGGGGGCVCEPEAERERHKQSYEIAGGRSGSKLLLFGTNAVSACKFQVL